MSIFNPFSVRNNFMGHGKVMLFREVRETKRCC